MQILKKIYLISFIICFIFLSIFEVSADVDQSITITILYDNYAHKKELKAEFGFSCLIEGTEKMILFDTGRAPDEFNWNIDKLKPNLKKVRQVVISHNHFDHTGNLFNFLNNYNNNVQVYLPVSFRKQYIHELEKTNAKVVLVDEPGAICRDVFLTGTMDGFLAKEQSMVLNTNKGLVIIVGCSHPGIVNIVKKAKEMLNKKVHFVFGGFHLLDDSADKVKEVIRELKSLGVEKVGPTHCSGDNAIRLFKESFKNNYIQMGVGKKIKL